MTSVVFQEGAVTTAPHFSACIVHVSEGNAQTRTRVLDEDELTIGRGSDCSLVVAVSHVSRVHLYIRREDDGWCAYDNKSVNGILVNGIRRQSAMLEFGDRIDLGRGEVLLYRPYDSDYQRALEAQKLEALGCLASGIAHDFNNVLMAIVGAAAGVSDDVGQLNGTVEVRESATLALDDIMTATERGADLARQLLSFAKRGGSVSESVSLDALAEEVARLVGRTFDRRIVVETTVSATATVVGSRSELSQVIMNLCINARDAMPHGGSLTILVEDCSLQTGSSTTSAVRLQVTDTGVGMSPEVRERIFEPFFSTKGEGRGTGLGMATTYGIVKKSGGSIDVHSEVGEGTTVEVIFPAQVAHSGETEKATENYRSDAKVSGQGRYILLAEDQDLVRKHTSRLLTRMGFQVLECVDGIEAVETVESATVPIALAMLDLQMPRRSGDEACRLIREIDSSLPIVMVSGNIQDPRIEELFEENQVEVLSKPYGIEDLKLALSQAR